MKNLKTPTEILNSNPEIKALWSARYIGYLYMLKLVRGYKTNGSCLVDEIDVKKAFELVKPKIK
jgi:hypothetical protein